MLSLHDRQFWTKPAASRICGHPECQTLFTDPPFAGKSGRFYCSRECRADMSDELSAEDRARLVS